MLSTVKIKINYGGAIPLQAKALEFPRDKTMNYLEALDVNKKAYEDNVSDQTHKDIK